MNCLRQLLKIHLAHQHYSSHNIPTLSFPIRSRKVKYHYWQDLLGAGWFIGPESFNLFSFIGLKPFIALRQPGCYIILLSVGCLDKPQPFNLRNVYFLSVMIWSKWKLQQPGNGTASTSSLHRQPIIVDSEKRQSRNSNVGMYSAILQESMRSDVQLA